MILILFLLSSSISQDLVITSLEHVPESCNFVAEEGLNFYECKDHGINYYVSVPAGCSTGGCGLILDMPGHYMTGQSQNALTGIREKGNAAGYIVVNAETVILDWRPTDTSWQGNADNVVEDIGALIDVLNVDEKKIHVTGFSQGCYMTWSLLCAATNEIASVACLGASGHDAWAVEDNVESCYKNQMGSKPKRAVMYHTGTFDQISPIQEGRNMNRKVRAWLEDFEYQYKAYRMTSPAIAGHCVPMGDFFGSQEESGLNDYDWQIYLAVACSEENGHTNYDWGQEVVDFFVANPKPATDTYSATVCDADPESVDLAALFVLTHWHVNIVIYGFAFFGLFSAMMSLCNSKRKNDFAPVEQNNEL